MKFEDFERDPCSCAECMQAGVSDKLQKRDRYTGEWLHGYPLKRLYEAQEDFWRRFHELLPRKVMR